MTVYCLLAPCGHHYDLDYISARVCIDSDIPDSEYKDYAPWCETRDDLVDPIE